MLFTSFNFLLFFVAFFALYWFVCNQNYKIQNILLLLASYIFYAVADWRMIPLLLAATLVFYWLGIQIQKNQESKKSKYYKNLGVTLGVGTLLYFKYFNFFIQSFIDLFNAVGIQS